MTPLLLSGAVKLNNLAFYERNMKVSGFVLQNISFNLRCTNMYFQASGHEELIHATDSTLTGHIIKCSEGY